MANESCNARGGPKGHDELPARQCHARHFSGKSNYPLKNPPGKKKNSTPGGEVSNHGSQPVVHPNDISQMIIFPKKKKIDQGKKY